MEYRRWGLLEAQMYQILALPLMEFGGQGHKPSAFLPGKNIFAYCRGRWVSHTARKCRYGKESYYRVSKFMNRLGKQKTNSESMGGKNVYIKDLHEHQSAKNAKSMNSLNKSSAES